MKVSVLGAAGGIGQAISLLLKNHLPLGSDLALYDVNPVVPGVAVDLSHIPTGVSIKGYAGDDLEEALTGSDIVVIPAGVPRKPGMTRDDLFNVNAGIVKNLMEAGAKACPKACFCIITNPVNSTVAIAAEILKKAGVYDPKKLFGVTSLDVIRSNTFVGEIKGSDPSKENVTVIGGHSGVTILPILSQVDGLSLDAEATAKLTDRIQNAGTEVVEAKAGGGSATLSMGAAALKFTLSLVEAMNGNSTIECAYVDSPEAPTAFFAQPVKLGKDGVESILSYGDLSAFEQEKLTEMTETLEKNIQKGIDFANS
jgi:malate dehydrogenase